MEFDPFNPPVPDGPNGLDWYFNTTAERYAETLEYRLNNMDYFNRRQARMLEYEEQSRQRKLEEKLLLIEEKEADRAIRKRCQYAPMPTSCDLPYSAFLHLNNLELVRYAATEHELCRIRIPDEMPDMDAL